MNIYMGVYTCSENSNENKHREEYMRTYANLVLIAGQDIIKYNGAVSIVIFVKNMIVDNSYVSI